VKFTPVRVVCKNTLNEALERGPAIRVAHTRDMKVRLEDAGDVVLKAIQRHFDELARRFQAMLAVQIAEATLHTYLKAVFPDPSPKTGEKRFKKALAQAQRDRQESARLFTEGKGNDLKGVRGTLWAAYNGVTEYVDFYRSTYGDTTWLEIV